MENFFNRLAGIALSAKIGALLAAVALIFAGYYFSYYSDLLNDKNNLEQQKQRLTQEKKDYEKRKQEYLAFRNEVNGLLEEQKELLRVLPKRDDIEQFIESVQAQIELAGLSKVSSVREPAAPVEMYTKIPVRMSLLGTYHQINHFFKNVGDLRRIVNIEDLALEPAGDKDIAHGTSNTLKASFVATTFQFVDKEKPVGQQAKPGATSISSGGGK